MDFNDFDEQTKQEAIKAYVEAHPEIQEAAERRVRQKYEPPKPTPPKAPQPEGVVTVGGPVDVKRDPNPDRPGPRPRSGGISAFASDGRGNFSRGRYVDGKWQEEEWSTGVEGQMSQQARMLNLARKGQQQDFGEFNDVVETGKRNRAQQLVSLQNSTASMMKLANGGMVPREAIELFNRKYGGDGVTSGLLPTSGFRANGDFVLDFVQGKDAMGNPIVVSQKASPIMQWEIMNRNGVVFNDEDRANQRARLKKSGMSDAELDRFSNVFKAFNQPAGGGAQQRKTDYMRSRNEAIMKMVPELAKETILDFTQDQQNGRPVPKYKNDEELVAAAVSRYDAIQRAINKGFAPPEGMDPVLAKHLGYTVSEPEQETPPGAPVQQTAKQQGDPKSKWGAFKR